MKADKIFVISLGGSLISTQDGVDVEFLKKLRAFIVKRFTRGERFILVCGGGKVCRDYQKALKGITKVESNDLDWIGITTTYLNADLIRLIFKEYSFPSVVNTPDIKHPFKEKIMPACGNKPGHSSDNDAVHLAFTYGAFQVINLTNVDKVYTGDPREDKTAKPLENVSWAEYLKIVGSKWSPGANYPFDPVASKFAAKNGIAVTIARGGDFKNLANILDGKKFVGTLIK